MLTNNYITELQLADLLGVSRRTLRRWHVAGTGPNRTLVSRRILYRLAAVETWLASREQPARGRS